MPAPRDHVAFWVASVVLVAAAVTAYVALLGPAPRPPPHRPPPAVAAPETPPADARAAAAPAPAPAPAPPPVALEVAWPEETPTRERRFVLRGRAAPGSYVAVRGERVRVAADGSFVHVLFLKEGEQRLTVSARDRQGRRAEVVSPAIVLDTRHATEAEGRRTPRVEAAPARAVAPGASSAGEQAPMAPAAATPSAPSPAQAQPEEPSAPPAGEPKPAEPSGAAAAPAAPPAAPAAASPADSALAGAAGK